MRKIIRLTHRYLSFFIAVQLLLWTISGIYFAFNKIEEVRGEQYRLPQNFNADLNNLNLVIEDASNIKVLNRLGETIISANNGKNQYFDLSGNIVNKIKLVDSLKIVEQNTTLQPIESTPNL